MKRIGWLYKLSRSWGDGVFRSLWNAVRGKFPKIGV